MWPVWAVWCINRDVREATNLANGGRSVAAGRLLVRRPRRDCRAGCSQKKGAAPARKCGGRLYRIEIKPRVHTPILLYPDQRCERAVIARALARSTRSATDMASHL